MTATGTLYGLGVGPGDPELVTLKAWRLLSTVEVVAYPRTGDGVTAARDVVDPFVPDDIAEIPVDIPMCANPEPAIAAYARAADRLAQELEIGRDVAFLCIGDPLFYGSFMYLAERLSGRFRVCAVPGVTAPSACAAAAGISLASRNEVVRVIPAPLDDDRLRSEIEDGDTLVFIKVGRHLERLRRLLDEAGLSDRAVLVAEAGGDNEVVAPLAQASNAPYFSTVIVIAEKNR